jgi:glutaryl-CoA dehydrogenase (non-decarboxylating)
VRVEFSSHQKQFQTEFRAFADEMIVPYADQFDAEERMPRSLIDELARRKYLAATLPAEVGGLGGDAITFGLLNEEIGRGCSSVRSLLTVHTMVSQAILRWGSGQQKDHWLPRLASGEIIGAFALSEPDVGSDAKSVTTTVTRHKGCFLLNGCKKWITYGQIADLFLLFAQCDGQPTAVLVERNSPGLTVMPLQGMLGTRAAMLAELHLDACEVPDQNLLGGIGFGFAAVAASALDWGRYSVAWGCVGIGQACLEASLAYSQMRQQFGVYLKKHQLIRQMITNMVTNVDAARLLCCQAGYLMDKGDVAVAAEIFKAKYFASTMATRIAADAVQIHGANGCSAAYPLQRYWRDAKIMEIIEGSTQIQQLVIAKHAFASNGLH